jgi:hypothetical protein
MNLHETMEKYGFGASLSGGGCEWYTKSIKSNDSDAYIAITDDGGLGLPESLDDPIIVGIYDLDSGELIEDCKNYGSLKDYLDSIEKV